MPGGLITAIERQKKKKERYSVFLDGEYAFGLSGYVFLKHGLKAGMDLSTEKKDEILMDEELERQWSYVLRILTISDRTTSEIVTKLKLRHVPQPVISGIRERLERQNLADDSAIARRFLESKEGHGYHYLYSKLSQKGILKEEIRKALKEHFERRPESAIAGEFLESSKGKWAGARDRQARVRKIAGLLKNRGFSDHVIYELVERYAADAGEAGED